MSGGSRRYRESRQKEWRQSLSPLPEPWNTPVLQKNWHSGSDLHGWPLRRAESGHSAS